MRLLLIGYVIAVGTLLTLDSGAYFASVRGNVLLGYMFATAVESAALALAYIRQTDNRLLYAGWLIAGLYAVSVVSAGITVAEPALATLATRSHSEALTEAAADLKQELTLFDSQNQRGNTARAANRAAQVRDEKLALSRQQTKTPFWVWLDVVLAFASRLLVQLSAIWFAAVAGGMHGKKIPVKRATRKTKAEMKPVSDSERSVESEPKVTMRLQPSDVFGDEPAAFVGKGRIRNTDGTVGDKAKFTSVLRNDAENGRQYMGFRKVGKQVRRHLVRCVEKELWEWNNTAWRFNAELNSASTAGQLKLYKF